MSSHSAGMRKFARFALVGGIFAAINVLLLALLVSSFGLHYLAACTISFFILNFLSYLLNKTFTFRLPRQIVAREIARYYLVMAASLAANLFLMYLLVGRLSLHYLLASAVVIAALSLFNYLGHAAFSFRQQAGENATHLYDVLQVSAFFPEHGGGIEVVAGRLATAWHNSGMRVIWCAGQQPTSQPLSHDGVTRLPASYWDPLERRIGLPLPVWYLSAVSAMWRAMRQSRVVQLHDVLYTPCMLAMLFAWLQGKPVVLTQHIGELPIRNFIARIAVSAANRTLGRWMLTRADQVVFIASPVLSYFYGFTRFRRAPLLIPNGVDHEMFRPEPRAENQKGALSFLFVGRFVEKKGIHLLKSSLHIPGTHWAFAGKGPLDPATWPNLPSSVRLAGQVTAHQLAELYRQADLLVLPSVGEGFPLVVQEALACGTPVLVSTDVANACPNRDPSCVFEVDVSGADAEKRVEEKLTQLVSTPLTLRSARTSAIKLAQQWSWDRCSEEYQSIYSAISKDAHRA